MTYIERLHGILVAPVEESILIGVISKENEKEIVQEFFELFKTPWEFYKKDKNYDVVLLTCDPQYEIKTNNVIIYGSQEISFDRQNEIQLINSIHTSTLSYKDFHLPIYGNIRSFHENSSSIVRTVETDDIVAIILQKNHRKIIRVGFDLFKEIEYLLRSGQSSKYALSPTLDIHIEMLRDWIIGINIPLIEILNYPAGFDFTVCLTHDVDFLRLRDHKFDHTMFGFLYRAIFYSFRNFLKRKLSLLKLLKNWSAVCLLPGVYLGLIKDYFFQIDKYLEVERGLVSTFFILPFKNRAGMDHAGQMHSKRSARYDVDDMESEINKLILAGREIALHGIDAWCDPIKGQDEFQRIARIIGSDRVGVRSHWLYQSEHSPQYLEQAGFAYDSSAGYNDTIGYYSGTTQIFRPLRATTLLELPLHIMDTALFYANHMDLAEPQAMALVEGIMANAQRFGGVLTINWHHRSMGAERLWDSFYTTMIARLKDMKVWFATASQAVSWFSARRSVAFHEAHLEHNQLKVRLSSPAMDHLPLLLRVHIPQEHSAQINDMSTEQGRIIDISFSHDLDISICL